MTDAWYPTEISAREAELGFELLEIYASDSFCQNSFYVGWVSVVAKILGDSDLIVKKDFGNGFVYVHCRFGKDDYDTLSTTKAHWINLSNGFQTDPNQAIVDASFGADCNYPIKIITAKAEIRRHQK